MNLSRAGPASFERCSGSFKARRTALSVLPVPLPRVRRAFTLLTARPSSRVSVPRDSLVSHEVDERSGRRMGATSVLLKDAGSIRCILAGCFRSWMKAKLTAWRRLGMAQPVAPATTFSFPSCISDIFPAWWGWRSPRFPHPPSTCRLSQGKKPCCLISRHSCRRFTARFDACQVTQVGIEDTWTDLPDALGKAST